MDDKIKSIASANHELSLVVNSFINKVTENILVREGVPKETWKMYKEFAREIAKASLHYSSMALFIAIDTKKAFYVSGYNADPSILDKIVKDIISQVPQF